MRGINAFYNTLLDKVKQNTFKDLFVHNNEEVSSFNEKLKEFIELQQNNDEIDLEIDVPDIKKIPVSKTHGDETTEAFMAFSGRQIKQ